MSVSVTCKNVPCDFEHQNSELWLPDAEWNVGCDGDGNLCGRQANVMKSSTKSEIDISSFDKKQCQRRSQTRLETKPANGLSDRKSMDLLKSKSLGLIPGSCSGVGKKKSPDPKQQVVKRKAFDVKSKAIDCYENRMFHFPYINQIAPRLPPSPSLMAAKKNVTEYHDEINKIGAIIIRHQLHNHSKCGKQGRHCEHDIPELYYKLKLN